MTNKLGRLSGGLPLALYAGLACAAEQLDLQSPATRIASENYDLRILMIFVILAVFCVVFGVMFYSIYAHRNSVGDKAEQFHRNTTVEIIWTVIPFVILVGMAWPATNTLIALKDAANPDIVIRATGYQWTWGYDYLKGEGEGVAFLSAQSAPRDRIHDQKSRGDDYQLEVDNPLVVPVGKKVRILTTASDVAHSFWVPALGIKQDAIPGFLRDTWFRADKEGTYRGQRAESSGKDQRLMPIVVEVVSQEKYTKWVAGRKKKTTAAAEDSNKQWSANQPKAGNEKTGDAARPDEVKALRK